MKEVAYVEGRGGWMYILLQDNDLRLTIPQLMFPLSVPGHIG